MKGQRNARTIPVQLEMPSKASIILDSLRQLRELHKLVEQSVPHPRSSFRKKADEIMCRLEAVERYVIGKLSQEDFKKYRDELFDETPPPPEWLPLGLAELISAAILVEKLSGNKKATVELAAWIKAANTARKGRPVNENLRPIYQQAAEMRESGRSWGFIAKKLCPLLKSDPVHRCTKPCEDRIRLGAEQYLPVEPK